VRYGRIGLLKIYHQHRKCAESRRSKCGAYSERQTPPLVEEEDPISEHMNSLGTNIKYVMYPDWDQKPRHTVLARASSNLPDLGKSDSRHFHVCLFMFYEDVDCFSG
jgi:hypothetical protein